MKKEMIRLQTELESGRPEDRKFFELAAAQSKREVIHTMNESRRKELQRECGILKDQVDMFRKQNEDLRKRVATSDRFKGLQVPYLRDVVLKYMSFPAGSSERHILVPVIATLLKFTQQDLHGVEAGGVPKNIVDSWSGVLRSSSATKPGSDNIKQRRISTAGVQSPSAAMVIF